MTVTKDFNTSLSSVLQHSENVNNAQTAIFVGHSRLGVRAAY
jgi:hypothetical protein